MSATEYLITGSGGMLGQAFVRALGERNARFIALPKSQLDITNAAAVDAVMQEHRPAVVIHCAAFTRVDDAESQALAARAVNTDGTANVAAACARVGARLIFPSTDYVFDGTARVSYPPNAPKNPINEYGRTKLAGERAARAAEYLIVRTSWLYGPSGPNFVRTISRRLAAGEALRVVDDQTGTPTWTEELAPRILALAAATRESGVYHMTGGGCATWYDFAVAIARELKLETPIGRRSSDGLNGASRPAYSVLDCTSTDALIGPPMDWRAALNRAIAESAF